MNFDESFERLIGHEGKFQKHRNDRGNWTSGVVGVGALKGTKYGISAMSYPHLDIKNLTLDQAKAIYRKDFWGRFKGDEINSGWVRFNVFDACVHHGVGNGIRCLQRAVGVADDGHVGPLTLGAANIMDAGIVVSRLNAERILLAAKLSTWEDFGRGWARRFANNILEATRTD